jgi:hypothetical protein
VPRTRLSWLGLIARRAKQVAHRAQISAPVLQGLIALVVYLAVWLPTMPYRLVAHPTRPQLDQASMDPNFFVWNLRWWPYAVSHFINPLHTTQIGAPRGFALAWVTTAPPLGLLASPLTETMGPTVSFNLLTVLAIPLAAWAAFVFCRRLTGRFWPALVGGGVFGFSAYEMNHSAAGQLNLTYSLLLPVIGYLVLLWRDGAISRATFVVLTGLAMAVQFYLFLEIFADMIAMIVLALVVGYLLAASSYRPQVARLAGLLGLAVVLGLVLAAPYLYVALAHQPTNHVHGSGLDLASLILPRPGRTFGLHWHWLVRDASKQPQQSLEGYVGIPLFVLAVALAALNWSSRMTRFLAVMLAITIVAALGPAVNIDGHRYLSLPWGGVWHWPILRSAFPARLILFAFLVLAAMTAIFLAGGRAGTAAGRWGRLARWLLGGLVIAAVVFDAPFLVLGNTPTVPRSGVPAFISGGRYRDVLSPGETVVVISQVGNAGMLWQAETNFYFRLAGGYVNTAITPRTDLPQQIQELAHASQRNIASYVSNFRQLVVGARVGAILVERNDKPLWAGILTKIGLRSAATGGVLVYPTHGCSACRVPGAPAVRPRTSAGRYRTARPAAPDG